jgi:hypothetical protein
MRCLFLGYVSKTGLVHGSYEEIATGSHKLEERIKTRSTEEYRRMACEEFACETEDFICAVVQ